MSDSSDSPRDPEDARTTESRDLIRFAQAGDMEALGRLFERYRWRVFSIVRVRLGVALRERLESADLVQDTFVAAIEDFERFEVRHDASLIQWLAKLAENRIRAAARQAGAQKRSLAREVAIEHLRAASDSGPLGYEPADSGPLPPELAAAAEDMAALVTALDCSGEEEREVILLRHFAGGSWEWVAEQMKLPSADAARKADQRARKALTRVLRRIDRR